MSAPPTAYNRIYDFASYQTSSPNDPLPAAQLESELDAIEVTVDGLVSRLAEIQADDGSLRPYTTKGADLASAATLTLGTDGNYFDVTGTVAITALDRGTSGPTAVVLQFDSSLTLTHHATNLILPGAANITTATGDHALFQEYADDDWRLVAYQRKSAVGGNAADVSNDSGVSGATVSAALDTLDSGKASSSHTHAASDITSGTLADARVAASNVTQHQASLSVTESQVSDLGTTTAMVADNLSVFASTTSAQLAGVISDETGSGALVFGTSPTLTTPALGTPSALVLTNATGLPEAQVTQHEAALSLDLSQVDAGTPLVTTLIKTNGAGAMSVFSGSPYGTVAMDSAGTAVTTIKNNLAATAAPTVNDDSIVAYGVGSRWIDVTNDKEYVCLDATSAAAVWTETTGGGGGSLPVNDTTAVVQDPADNTKLARIDAGAITTGTTRVITMGDRDVDLASGGTFAEASHNHAASEVTSGTLVHERGGLEADVSAYNGLVKISGGATSAVTDASADWNSAFGWGDHALAGYLTPDALLNGATGDEISVDIGYTVNKATSGDDYGLRINKTDTASPGFSYLMALQLGGVNVLDVQDDGTTSLAGTFDASMGITASGGSITADSGDIVATTGNVDASSGSVTASAFTFASPPAGDYVLFSDSIGGGIDSTATTQTEVEMLSGKTLTGTGSEIVSGAVGTSGNLVKWNATGDAVDASIVAADVKTTRVGVKRYAWFDAGAGVAQTTSGMASATEEKANNDVMSDHFLSDDATNEYVQFRGVLDNWDGGSVKVKVYWEAAAASGDAIFQVACLARTNGEATDAAFGLASSVTDTTTGANQLNISDAASPTLSGEADGDLLWIRVMRYADAVGDTLSGDCKVLGVRVQYTEDSSEDASW